MDDDLKRKIAASLDLPEDASADPEVVAALENNPQAHAFARGLYVIEDALQNWPQPRRTAADWEKTASGIERRLGEAPWEKVAKVRGTLQPISWNPLESPPLSEDESLTKQPEQKPMSQPRDDRDADDDLEGLAALTKTSSSPTTSLASPSRPSMPTGPSISDDAMDESSGIVDIQKLAALALKQSLPPKANDLAPTREETAPDHDTALLAREVAKSSDAKSGDKARSAAGAVPPANASATPVRAAKSEPAERKGGAGVIVWVVLAAAAAGGGVFFFMQNQRSSSPMGPSHDQASNDPAPASNPESTGPAPAAAAPSTAATPSPSAPPPAAAAPGSPDPAAATAAAAPAAGATTATPPPGTVEAAAPTGTAANPPAAVVPAVAAPGAAAPAVAANSHAPAAPQIAPVSAPHATRTSHSSGSRASAAPSAPATPTPAPVAAARPTPATTPSPATATSAPAASAGGTSRPAGGAPAAGSSIDDLMARAVGRTTPPATTGATRTGGSAPAAGSGGGSSGASGSGAAATAAPTEIPDRPSRSQVTASMAPLSSAIRACAQGQTGMATVAMTVASDGTVQSASVSGPFNAAATGCMTGVVRRAHFPAFRRPTVPLLYPFSIQPRNGAGAE